MGSQLKVNQGLLDFFADLRVQVLLGFGSHGKGEGNWMDPWEMSDPTAGGRSAGTTEGVKTTVVSSGG